MQPSVTFIAHTRNARGNSPRIIWKISSFHSETKIIFKLASKSLFLDVNEINKNM
jgi:hypothetical protein